jgi:cell division protein FtsB
VAVTPVRSDDGTAGAGSGATPSRHVPRRAVAFVGLLVVLGVAVAALVAPVRQLVTQERRVADTRRQISDFETSNGELSRRIRTLESDVEIERLAREDLGLVRPGEEPYVLVPGDPAAEPPPSTELRRPEPLPKSKSRAATVPEPVVTQPADTNADAEADTDPDRN